MNSKNLWSKWGSVQLAITQFEKWAIGGVPILKAVIWDSSIFLESSNMSRTVLFSLMRNYLNVLSLNSAVSLTWRHFGCSCDFHSLQWIEIFSFSLCSRKVDLKLALRNPVESCRMCRRAPETSDFTTVKQGYISSPNIIIGRFLIELKFNKNIYSEHLDCRNFIV